MVDGAASGSRKYERSPSYILFLRLLSVVGVWLYWSWHCFLSVFDCLPVYFRYLLAGLHKLWYPSIRDTSTWSKFEAHGEHGDVFLFSNLGAL